MRVRVTILLLVANLFTAFLIIKIEGGREFRPTIAAPLFPSEIQSISIEGVGTLPYTLERNQRGWSITKPFLWDAGPLADHIVEQLRFMRIDSGFSVESAQANGSTLGTFGLDKPAARLTVRGGNEGEKPVVVEIGLVTTSAGDARVSLLTPSGRILTATRKFYETLVVPPDALRSNTIFGIEPFQVRNVAVRIPAAIPNKPEHQIRIKADQLPIPSSPDTERIWRFEVPIEAEASLPLTDAAVARLTTLRVLRFPPRSESAPASVGEQQSQRLLGLNPPLLRLTIEGNDRAQTLLVGFRDQQSATSTPARYAKLDDNATIFTIPENAVLDWRDADKRLREREFLRFHPDQLAEIAIHSPRGEKLVIQRRGSTAESADSMLPAPLPASGETAGASVAADTLLNDWNIPGIPGGKTTATLATDPLRMRKLISETLRHIAAIPMLSGDTPAGMEKYCAAFVNDSPTPDELAALGFTKPARRVELRFKDGSLKTLRLAAPIAKGTPWHALIEGKNQAVYSVDGRIAEELSTDPSHYRSRLIARTPPGATITSVKITDLKDGATLFNLASGTGISLNAAIEALPEDERPPARALLSQIHLLQARAYLPGPFTKELRHKHPYAQTPAEWLYRMDVSLRIPGAKTDETRTLFLTARLGGTLQIGGAPVRDCLFELEQPLIDALFPLSHLKSTTTRVPDVKQPADLPPSPAAPAAVPAPAVVPAPAPAPAVQRPESGVLKEAPSAPAPVQLPQTL